MKIFKPLLLGSAAFSFILAAMGLAANTIDTDGYKYVVEKARSKKVSP